MSETILDADEVEDLISTGRVDRSDIESEILETAGISSEVWIEEDGEETIAGHTLLADYDDDISFPRDDEDDPSMTRLDRVEREARDLDGITALLQSSEGSFHLWNLSVEDLSSRVLQGLAMHGDPMHVAVSWRRSKFILRCSPKVYSTSIDEGEPRIDKEAPALIDVFASESDSPQSRGHWAMLRTLAEQQGREELLSAVDPMGFGWIGRESDIVISRYFTVTDELKREVW